MAKKNSDRRSSKGGQRLPYGFNDACDLFRKLERDAKRVAKAKRGVDLADHFFNFLVTGFHLVEWIEKSFPHIPEKEIQDLKSRSWFGAIRELANASKHFALNYETRRIAALCSRYVGSGPIPSRLNPQELTGISVYIKESEIESPKRYSVLEFVNEILDGYREFAERHGICVDRIRAAEQQEETCREE